MMLVSYPNQSCLEAHLKDLEQFSKITGLKLNFGKSLILRVDTLKGTIFRLPCNFPITRTNRPVKVLGIMIPEKLEDLCTINFNNKMAKIDKILQPWR